MLTKILFANALSCALFGVTFLFFGAASANFLGTPPVLLLQILGAGLLFNAGHLIFVAVKQSKGRKTILYFAFGDALWVLATIIFLIGGIFVTTQAGVWFAIAVALFVGACGTGQYILAPKH